MLRLNHFRRKYYKSIWHRWSLLLIIFGCLVLTYILTIVFFVDFTKDDYHSWFISFSGSLLFFAIGLITAILGSRLPQEESFAIRISALSNGKYANKDAEKYLSDKIRELMTYTKDYYLLITLKKFSADKSHVYLHIESYSVLVNMCEDEEILLSVKGSVTPGRQIDGTFGQVTHHSVKRENLPELELMKTGDPIALNDQKGHKHVIDKKVPINANSKSNMKLCYDMWVPADGNFNNEDDFFFHGFPIFTESADIKIKNETTQNINYKYAYSRNKEKRYTSEIDKSTDEVYSVYSGTINATDEKNIGSNVTFEKGDNFNMYLNNAKEAT